MSTQMAPSAKYRENTLPYLLLMTFFFVLLEVSFFIQSNKAYLVDYQFVASKIHIPATILPAIIGFVVTQLMLHLLYCLFIWRLAIIIADFLFISPSFFLPFNLLLWWMGIITILVSNQYFFPNSKFSYLTEIILFQPFLLKFAFVALLFFWSALLSIAVSAFFYRHLIFFTMMIAVSLFINAYYRYHSAQAVNGLAASKPNIIIVGVDSLRPDFLSYASREKANTPFIDAFLQQSSVFTASYTPLARTFPSWVSILTGEYPKQNGVRSNLVEQAGLDFNYSLPHILHAQGYETIYATDETRFSNIDKNMGFERIISPPVGLNDFLLGTFNDFPLSNLLVNTRVGKWLFPYSYANRAVFFTYEPRSFLTLVRDYLNQKRDKPLFLAIHFCMPHHPYRWADFTQTKADIVNSYAASVTRADLQLKRFFRLLSERKILDNAIVVLLSDHGEALEMPGDRVTQENLFVAAKPAEKKVPVFYPPNLYGERFNQSGGHGTDVLGLTQYHTLLAIRLFGQQQYHGEIKTPVTLLSIKPTLLDLLGIHPPANSVTQRGEQQKNNLFTATAISLASAVRDGKIPTAPSPDIFLESDFSPASIHTVFPETRQVVLEGVHLFRIDPTSLRLTVKPEMMRMIIQSKQYADLYGNWILALYPQADHSRVKILVNLKTGEWTNDLNSAFAQHSPAQHMLRALNEFYADEL